MCSFIAVSESKNTLGEIINSASQFEVSIKETVDLISKIIGREVEIISEKKRLRPSKSEVNRLFGSNEKLKRLTSWQPNFAGKDGFKKGLKNTIEWFRDPNNLKSYRSDYII